MFPMNLAGLSLRDLEYAVAVSELRHFGRAAEQCGVSQPALSEQVRKLEDLLGVTLFDRGNRQVRPTEQGEAILSQARGILQQARLLLEMAQSQQGSLTGTLRLGVIPTLGPYYLPSVLRSVLGRLPGLSLQIEELKTGDLLDALRVGKLDIGLLAWLSPMDGIVAEPILDEPFLLACPTGHPLAFRRDVNLDELPVDGLLLLEEGHCLRDQALSLCARHGSRAANTQKQRFACSLEMLRHMIAAGEGYSLLPALAARGREDLHGLLSLSPLTEAAVRRICLIWRGSDPRGDGYGRLAGLLRDNIPEGALAVMPDRLK
ncbi:Hydrogen peroxide-inducible genes activator [Granulibacter bethesdensis]|uniref:Hydrogen peroxide-inducible genes activator n=1 Tax=Granulibacter bethesdensis TaxID=364410 RepID=A0AAC9KB54_9PROT|nr:LysR substrate-binding domain-containing protein [Granulibacter bethesdensis]APH55286.1 Hydrogen peroxide-inducible genes activator [Granulibacter bethesdensis]APH62873.1 Hydrogen peroxide-inducible genes activator [Granulibacter bethesdensis]